MSHIRLSIVLLLAPLACSEVPLSEAESTQQIHANTGFSLEETLLIRAVANEDPPTITLNFPRNGRTSGEECLGYDVFRKEKGAEGWTKLNSTRLACDTTSFTASSTSAAAYEYMVERHHRIESFLDEASQAALMEYCDENPESEFCDFETMCASDPFWCDFMVPDQLWSSYGFIYGGVAFPAVHDRGKLVLIVDETVAEPLAYELDRLRRDLTGDGWEVVRHDFVRGGSPDEAADVRALKALVRTEYDAAPSRVQSVLLFGHLPVPYSGAIMPDGHTDHRGAWPTDTYYGDMDFEWTDSWLDAHNRWSPRQTNVPGDGKFDHSIIPSDMELAVGRVDLSDLPLFAPMTEVDLLRRYLDKHHAFRNGTKTFDPRALMSTNGDARFTIRYALDDLASYFDLDAIDAATANSSVDPNWLTRAETGSYLWGYAGDSGHWRGMYHLGWAEEWQRDVNVAFLRLYGSYFGDWDYEDAFLRAPLAGPNALVSFWDKPFTGNRNWFFHMGLGDTIGSSMRFAQNEHPDYPRTGHSSSAMTPDARYIQHRYIRPQSRSPIQRPLYLNLMGDPSLRMHIVEPPSDVRVNAEPSTNHVTWISNGTEGHFVYRAPTIDGPFELLTPTPVAGAAFVDAAPTAGTRFYAVKAAKLETTPSGTFWNTSQAKRSRCGDLGACIIERPNVTSINGALVADMFVVGAVIEARLEILNFAGAPYGHLGWDTDPATARADLVVYEDGQPITRADGSLAPRTHGAHMLGFIGANGSRYEGRLVRVVVELDDQTILTSPVTWYGTPPAVGVAIARTAMRVDVMGQGDGWPARDGRPDGVFDVTYAGPVKNIALVGVDDAGAFNMWAYDTLVGDVDIPPALGNYPSGAHTWTLGVERDGKMKNTPSGALDPMPWVRSLRLYATQTAFLNGRRWKVVIELPDGTTTESAVFTY